MLCWSFKFEGTKEDWLAFLLQCCRVLKNGQAGISKFFNNTPGWNLKDKNEFGKWVQK